MVKECEDDPEKYFLDNTKITKNQELLSLVTEDRACQDCIAFLEKQF